MYFNDEFVDKRKNHRSQRFVGIKEEKKRGEKKDLLQPKIKAKIDFQIRVVRGASCLLRGRG